MFDLTDKQDAIVTQVELEVSVNLSKYLAVAFEAQAMWHKGDRKAQRDAILYQLDAARQLVADWTE